MRQALRGTSNRSAPGQDGISDRFMKVVLNNKLGEVAIREVVRLLKEGRILEEW